MASYYVWSGAGGSANGTSWANAYTTLTAAFSGKAAGDVFYVAHDHVQTIASTLTLSTNGTLANPTKVVCVDRAGSVPPVSADRRATAQVTTTGAANIALQAGTTHWDGIIFNCGTGAVTAHLQLQGTGNLWSRFDNCSLRLVNTGISVVHTTSSANGGVLVELNNTTVSFAAATQQFQSTGILRWRNTASALLGTAPTVLFAPAARGILVECIGIDLSAMGSGTTIVSAVSAMGNVFKFVDCKLNASVTKSAVPTTPGSTEIDFIRSGSSGVNYTIHRHRMTGLLIEETTIVRTGGASDGTTPLSWKVVTTASCSYSLPFECPPIAIWNDTVGSPVTATVECIAATLMTDKECWLDVEYLSSGSSPQGAFATDAADILATAANQTSSSETWGGSTAAFKLVVTFTAQQAGWIYAMVKVGKASSTVYIDPLVTLT